MCIGPSLEASAICMGPPQTVTSEVGPSLRGTLFFQVTRTKQAEGPLRILPAALQGSAMAQGVSVFSALELVVETGLCMDTVRGVL